MLSLDDGLTILVFCVATDVIVLHANPTPWNRVFRPLVGDGKKTLRDDINIPYPVSTGSEQPKKIHRRQRQHRRSHHCRHHHRRRHQHRRPWPMVDVPTIGPKISSDL